MIADDAQIERIAADARAAGAIALDTEFMGEGHYRTLLCLIQVAVPVDGSAHQGDEATRDDEGRDARDGNGDGDARDGDGRDARDGEGRDARDGEGRDARDGEGRDARDARDGNGDGDGDGVGDSEGEGEGERIDLIDPLEDGLDASPLAEVLADPDVQVVMHAGRQDVALLRRTLSTDVTNVFDTQLAAGFAGLAAQRSYESLLSQVLGVKLAKSASFTRWDRRPLTPEQLSYAREDVLHLLRLADALQLRLAKLGRLGWALQECEQIAAASDMRDLDAVFARLPRIGSAPPAAQAIARELVQWRERTAERQDRPVQSVLADAALVEVAKRKPATMQELTAIRGIPQGIARRAGAEVLEGVRRGQRRPPEPRRPAPRSQPPDPVDAPLVALTEALARARAAEAGLAYELIATRAELQAIVGARRAGEPEPEVRALTGWRRELLGQEMLRLIDGEISLSVKDGAVHVEG